MFYLCHLLQVYCPFLCSIKGTSILVCFYCSFRTNVINKPGLTSDHEVPGWNATKAEFGSWLCSASLHCAFHYQPAIFLMWRMSSWKHAYIILTPLNPTVLYIKIEVYIIFLIFAQNIDCGYSLEPARRGGSNEYPQSMFLSRNLKNIFYLKILRLLQVKFSIMFE